MSSNKTAYNTNLASEFHVLSILHRLGFTAYLTLGNKKSVDITVVRDVGDSLTIDVKGVAKKTDWLLSKPSRRPRAGHFTVLVGYNGSIDDVGTLPDAWVLPDREYLALIKTAKTGKTWYISRKVVVEQCSQFESAWHLLNEAPPPREIS